MKYRPVKQRRRLRARWDPGILSHPFLHPLTLFQSFYLSPSRSPEFILLSLSLSLPFLVPLSLLSSLFHCSVPFPSPSSLSFPLSVCVRVFFPYSTLVHPILLPLLPPGAFLTNVDFGGVFPVWRFQFVDRKEEERNSFEPRRATTGVGVSTASSILLHSPPSFWLGYRFFALSLFFPLSVLPSPHYFLSPLLFDCHCFLSQRELELVTWELSCLGEDIRRTNERLEREGEEDRSGGRNFVRLFRHRRNSWQKEGSGRGQGKRMHAGYEAIGAARKLRRLKRSSMIRSRRKGIESVTPSRLIYTSIYI